MTLLMASAPWSKQQFDEKGIDVLLETASRLPDLRLILLWRGLFAEDLAARVRARGLDNRVEVVNAKVDAGAYLRRAHATVLLAKRAEIIKAYPHSLIESLYAGKPVVTSNTIAMADFVRQQHCGLVLVRPDADSLVAALSKLREDYSSFVANAATAGQALAAQPLIECYRTIYGL
jgi:glycosyltransferase involved in cell wall biosynthesis